LYDGIVTEYNSALHEPGPGPKPGRRILAVMMRGGIAAAAIAGLAILAGCGASSDQAKAPGSTASAIKGDATTEAGGEGPRVITNLSQLSSAPLSNPMMNAQNLVAGTAALHDTAHNSNAAQSRADTNLEHLFLSKQRNLVHGGEARAAGDRTLLNQKARQYADFSYALLNQTLTAAHDLEAEKLERHKLPDEIKPVVLTAVMTPAGRLADITVELHSGVAAVDRIIIDACKKGLWAINPPKGALASDGTFRMRIEGAINNYSYDLEGNYRYITHLGLALM
jgi:hypothetical protein